MARKPSARVDYGRKGRDETMGMRGEGGGRKERAGQGSVERVDRPRRTPANACGSLRCSRLILAVVLLPFRRVQAIDIEGRQGQGQGQGATVPSDIDGEDDQDTQPTHS